MFDVLKKKISGFVDKFTKKEEEKPSVDKEEERREAVVEKPVKVEEKPKVEKPKPAPEEKIVEELPEKKLEAKVDVVKEPHVKRAPVPEPIREVKPPVKIKSKEKQKKVEPKKEEKPVEKPKSVKKKIEKPKPKPEKKEVETPKSPEPEPEPEPIKEEPPEEPKEEKIEEVKKPEKPPEEKPKKEVKVGVFSKLKGLVTGEVEIAASDISDLLDQLELEMLESDVSPEVAEEIKNELQEKLVGQKIKKNELNVFVKNAIKETLEDIVTNEGAFDLVEKVRASEKPVKIMFLGPNGAGKTTSIAKIAKMLIDSGFTVVFAAADTFRAAAVEQISIHAQRLGGIKTIKRDYGSDPTSVAFDAVNHAKANKIDVVLIDTAGRQETNLNLINELKKINRVIQPDITLYTGESIAGHAILDQVSEFKKEIGVDGVILTKLDCDAKGGTVLSISKVTGVPIVYIGTGQKYEDIEKFDPEKMIERIMG